MRVVSSVGGTLRPSAVHGSPSYNNNNNNNNHDIYSAVIYGASHMREFTVVPLGRKSVSARWPPTRRPSCKLDL